MQWKGKQHFKIYAAGFPTISTGTGITKDQVGRFVGKCKKKKLYIS